MKRMANIFKRLISVIPHELAKTQKNGRTAVFIDVEHSLDSGCAKRLGVDLDRLFVSQSDYGEQALIIAEVVISSVM